MNLQAVLPFAYFYFLFVFLTMQRHVVEMFWKRCLVQINAIYILKDRTARYSDTCLLLKTL